MNNVSNINNVQIYIKGNIDIDESMYKHIRFTANYLRKIKPKDYNLAIQVESDPHREFGLKLTDISYRVSELIAS